MLCAGLSIDQAPFSALTLSGLAIKDVIRISLFLDLEKAKGWGGEEAQ